MTTEQEIKQAIADAKSKISELDILISQLSGITEKEAILSDEHIPTDGQPFIYIFNDPIDKLPGIKVPGESVSLLGTRGNADFIFNGTLKMDGDSSFICHDLQAVQQLNWADEEDLAAPPAGSYWGPLALADLGNRYFGFTAPVAGDGVLFGSDFGFRITDRGTGRRFVQGSVNSSVDNAFIPGRFLGSGQAYSSFGPNYTTSLPFKHLFAKNTVVECEIKVYNSFEPVEELGTAITPNDLRVMIGLIGYKVFGD